MTTSSDGESVFRALKAPHSRADFTRPHCHSQMISHTCHLRCCSRPKCSIPTVFLELTISLSYRRSMHFHIAPSIRGPNESTIKTGIKMEPNFNDWGSHHEYHIDAGRPQPGLAGKRWRGQTFQVEYKRVQQKDQVPGQKKYWWFLRVVNE